MKIKSILSSCFRSRKKKSKKVKIEPQVYIVNSKIKFQNIKIYTGVFDVINEIKFSEIEAIMISSEYDRGNSEALIFIKITSREQMICIDNYMIGFEAFTKEFFKVFEIDKSFHEFYNRSTKPQYIYPLNRLGETLVKSDY